MKILKDTIASVATIEGAIADPEGTAEALSDVATDEETKISINSVKDK